MVKPLKAPTIYICDVRSTSSDLKSLKAWLLLLSLSHHCNSCTGLPIKTRRFTLLRSPLGNKTAKDQFERKEYGAHLCFQARSPSKMLKCLDLLKCSRGIKSKVSFKFFGV